MSENFDIVLSSQQNTPVNSPLMMAITAVTDNSLTLSNTDTDTNTDYSNQPDTFVEQHTHSNNPCEQEEQQEQQQEQEEQDILYEAVSTPSEEQEEQEETQEEEEQEEQEEEEEEEEEEQEEEYQEKADSTTLDIPPLIHISASLVSVLLLGKLFYEICRISIERNCHCDYSL
jgi:hypothetical protein